MRTLKTAAVAALSLLALVAVTSVAPASACDKTAEAATAGAACTKSADAATAGAACTKSADAATAGAACTKGADAATAGAACTKGASAVTAGASCMSPEMNGVKIETVRMPSGTLAVFYHGTNAETTNFLQAQAGAKGADFGCPLASTLANAENCQVDAASTSTGMMIVVVSEDAKVVDELENNYRVAIAEMTEKSGE